MKDKHHFDQNAWKAVRRSSQVPHQHYVTHARSVPDYHDQYRSLSVIKHSLKNDQLNVVSNSTDHAPLMRVETTSDTSIKAHTEPYLPFNAKYGRCLEISHYGTNNTIRIHHDKLAKGPKSEQLRAIKVYRPNTFGSSDHHMSHFSATLLSNLHPQHPNIVPILDLLYNDSAELCLVMPYCEGGNLHDLLSCSGPLPTVEADCLVAQILGALSFLHEHDTAHRNIRLETVLLTGYGAVKIAGFGDGHVRRILSECMVPVEQEEPALQPASHPHPSTSAQWSFSLPGIFSSFVYGTLLPRGASSGPGNEAPSSAWLPFMGLPYIPPEGFRHRDKNKGNADKYYEIQDPRPEDVWATGIIYLALITGRLLWRSARPHHEDSRYLEYRESRRTEDGYPPIEALGQRRRNSIYAMLNPNSLKRITSMQILQSEWINGVCICEAGQLGL
ncbi:hypothetical protein N7495_002788 [Penicillium taxi]|uniref:uncharacterized protein n=1 Tax=Penicillium taxi TaxID=168475 RepID=UPI0025458B14|nr:uncharacterized protein N7495_002788 [Penicillium taxi]KAJ5902260.1 hypothetical protein N7495_002788 [Penicillium taxi]